MVLKNSNKYAKDMPSEKENGFKPQPTLQETKGCFKPAKVISVAIYKTTLCKQVDHSTFTLLLNYVPLLLFLQFQEEGKAH